MTRDRSLRTRTAPAALAALLTVVGAVPGWSGAPVTSARADEGDADDGAGEAAVAVMVTGAPGVKLPAAREATVQVSMERALKRDRRLIVVDRDDRLAAKAGKVPTDVVNEARALLSAGEELLRRGQARQALRKLEGASVNLAKVLAWTQKHELARSQFLLGAAQALTGDKKEALATFTTLLAWRPDAVADPDIEPGTILPLWNKAQAAADKLAGGSIEIETAPEGAMAYVDGRLVGFTPTIIEGLAVGTHYVTLRRDGFMRRVEAVDVSGTRATKVAVVLDPTIRADELAASERAVAAGLGAELAPADAQAGLAEVADLLGVEHLIAVVVEPGEGRYHVYAYATDGGLRLGTVDVEVGERTLEDAFGEAAGELYRQVAEAKAKAAIKPKKPGKQGPRIYTRWWFWAAVGGGVALAVGVPLLLSIDRAEPLTCPTGTSCGEIVFRF